jgi:hypothetical protein
MYPVLRSWIDYQLSLVQTKDAKKEDDAGAISEAVAVEGPVEPVEPVTAPCGDAIVDDAMELVAHNAIP